MLTGGVRHVVPTVTLCASAEGLEMPTLQPSSGILSLSPVSIGRDSQTGIGLNPGPWS